MASKLGSIGHTPLGVHCLFPLAVLESGGQNGIVLHCVGGGV